jgi:putative ABC transport system permease protein
MLTIYLVRDEFIADWQNQLPPETPNHFVVNLPPANVGTFEEYLQSHNIKSSELYPMVRGRLVEINNRSLEDLFGENYREQHNSLRRELNLTWTTQFQESNKLLEGKWETSDPDGISVESEMAEALGLKLNDTLTFYIGGLTATGTVTSIRKVEWDSFEPNFYVIFKPGKLETFGATYISSFYLAKENKLLLNEMLDRFPSISILEMDRILQQVRNVLNQATIAIEFVMVFVIAAGLVVLFATTYATLDEKRYETGVLRTLGANNRMIFLCTFSEYWLLALLTGMLAIISTECIALGLYHYVFDLELAIHTQLLWMAPVFAMLLIVPAGLFAIRSVINTHPLQILNRY